MIDKKIFYSYEKLKSYNALLNFIVAERGVGKTFGAQVEVINDFLKNGTQFIYLRRYKTELASAINTFYDHLKDNGMFPDHELKTKKIKDGAEFYIDDQLMGWALPLSTSGILKSSSFPKVKTIVFDEFIIAKSVYHYLPDEVTQMLELIETVFRLRDNGRVWFLGNATTMANPYFMYFDLSVPYKSEYKTFKNGLILVNYVKNEEYRKVKKASRLGQLVEGTRYSDYAIDNKFLLDSKAFICKKPYDATFMFCLKVASRTFGVWRDNEGIMYIARAYDPNTKVCIAITDDDHTEDDVKGTSSSPFIQTIIDKYILGELRFEDQSVKAVMGVYLLA